MIGLQVCLSKDNILKNGQGKKLQTMKSPNKAELNDKANTISLLRDKLQATLDNTQKVTRKISKSHSRARLDERNQGELEKPAQDWKFVKLASPFTENISLSPFQTKGETLIQYKVYMFQDKSTKLTNIFSLKQVAGELLNGLVMSLLTEPYVVGLEGTTVLINRILELGGLYTDRKSVV